MRSHSLPQDIRQNCVRKNERLFSENLHKQKKKILPKATHNLLVPWPYSFDIVYIRPCGFIQFDLFVFGDPIDDEHPRILYSIEDD